ncbi:MAG: hypothetical protein ACPGO3_11815 [Magnetospiraceae bacterium]
MTEATSKPPLLLLLGAPRTGTTLLATALGAHRDIAMLDEDFHGAPARLVGGKLPGVKLCVPNQVHLTQRWRGLYKLARFNGFLRKRIGYRLPRSRLSIADYDQAFDLRIVCILREPARALEAISRRERLPQARAADMLHRCLETLGTLAADPGRNLRVISFDRFVKEPEAQCRALVDWLGLPFDPQMLEAPSRNTRYPRGGFDAGRAEGAPDVSVPENIARAYAMLLEKAL